VIKGGHYISEFEEGRGKYDSRLKHEWAANQILKFRISFRLIIRHSEFRQQDISYENAQTYRNFTFKELESIYHGFRLLFLHDCEVLLPTPKISQ